uniref:Methyltransferase domain-containing protein n=1 Tax=Neogobius melanostomus TaxID=47308 RepID=A0A8C6WSN9_9GOBI
MTNPGVNQDFELPHTDRSLQEARDAFKSCKNPQFYDQWAVTYNTDHNLMDYMAPVHTGEVLMKHHRLSPDQTRVLDVACGSGLVAKLLSSQGFRLFVGVDGSAAMLEEARRTALYQDVRLALLGTEPLPVDLDQFDVVTIVGALYPGFVPVKVVPELCKAAKPGGLVVMTRGNYQRPEHFSYTQELHLEMDRMEQEGLWRRLEVRRVEHYLSDPHQPRGIVQGSVYIYQKNYKQTQDWTELGLNQNLYI